MDQIIVLVAIISIVGAAVVLMGGSEASKKDAPAAPPSFPYRQAGPLFTPAERSFLGALEQVVDEQHRVFGKVRVADILKVNKMTDRKEWAAAFSRIKAKHFDFVVARRSDLSVVCVIELDDKSHGSAKAQARDAFINGACEAAGLPIVRIAARAAYSRTKIQNALNAEIGTAGAGMTHDGHADAAVVSSESITSERV